MSLYSTQNDFVLIPSSLREPQSNNFYQLEATQNILVFVCMLLEGYRCLNPNHDNVEERVLAIQIILKGIHSNRRTPIAP